MTDVRVLLVRVVVLLWAGVWLAASPASAQDAASPSPQPRELLMALCGAHRAEPACGKLDTITDDEAWVLVRNACREGTEKSRACEMFRRHTEPVLILDAVTGRWTAEREYPNTWPLKLDVTGVPTLRLQPRDAPYLKVLVENLSPLAYSASPGTPREEDLAVIADLKSVLELAGTGVQAVIAASSFSPPAPPTLAVPAGTRQGAQASAETGAKAQRRSAPPTACKPAPPQVADLARAVGDRNAKLLDLNSALRALAAEVAGLSAARDHFVSVMQRAERGATIHSADLAGADAGALSAAYARVDRVAARLQADGSALADCQPVMSAYGMLLSAPADARVVTALAQEVQRSSTGCALATVFTIDANSLVCTADQDPSKLETELKLHGAAMKPFVDRLIRPEQAEQSIWTAVSEARTSQVKIMAGVETLARQVDRGLVHSWNGTMMRGFAVTRPNPELPWSKVQTHSIVIKVDSPYAKDVTLAHETPETHEYKLESATGQLLGYGIAVVYTPLRQSSWAAVTGPDGTAKVIGETKRETRAGDVAAFLSYRFLEHWPRREPLHVQPTLDFGVGLSGVTAFFLGGGAEVWRVARIGAGWSPQRVTVLADGQTVGAPVASSDDIRTVDRFAKKNWYVSFSFALDSLSLFHKP